MGYTSIMRCAVVCSVILTLLALAGASYSPRAQSAPAESAKAADASGDDALLWERDFELLLELKNIPTRAQIERESRIQELLKERLALQRRLADLNGRMAALQGSYTSETLNNELLRQGVLTSQQAQKNLKDEADQTTDRLREVESQLRRIGATPKD